MSDRPASLPSKTTCSDDTTTPGPQHIILFYKFHPLAKDSEIVELYRAALEKLCRALNLQGRILVGCNEHQSEGINGTLSGSASSTEAFTNAMAKHEASTDGGLYKVAMETFWEECDKFYTLAGCEPLVMESSEFKWSTCEESQLFPDLNIKLVKELIGTGGVLAPIPLDEVHQGYLTPAEWHERISQLQRSKKDGTDDDTVLIDCRNTKEWQIGRFTGAPDPSTTTFNQFPAWVQQHSQTLANKKVLMYCTGGIRCEKASAFIRRQIPSVQEVRHLKGGIHKYLDAYGGQEDCLWKGKNFVFDGRGAHGAAKSASGHSSEQQSDKSTDQNDNGGLLEEEIVGSCLYCDEPHDIFEPGCVCTVCREPTLVCPPCRHKLREHHCQNHSHLRHCYFTDLTPFPVPQLQEQMKELRLIMNEIAVGRKFKQKRKTLSKQCDKISDRISQLEKNPTIMQTMSESELKCRNCGQVGCSGKCWGFHGLKRKRVLEQQNDAKSESEGFVAGAGTTLGNASQKESQLKSTRRTNNSHLQEAKALERQRAIDELLQLNLFSPPSTGRNPENGIRIPDECTRILQTKTKGKWCGRVLLSVLQEEYKELSDPETLQKIIDQGLLLINGRCVKSLQEAESLRLKNMDVISRVSRWHEPPVRIPNETIHVQRIPIPDSVREEYELGDESAIYVCDKPSTVPVHPAGPYLSNSLTMMVEAQEKMEPKSLIPCHRIDRVTSGLTICCTNSKIARLIQSQINEGRVGKQYLARVHGKFPSTAIEATRTVPVSSDIAQWSWSSSNDKLHVRAPVETVDPKNGIRKITSQGKPAQSIFQFIAYDEGSKSSLIACTPITGRGHQLRVHLQWLGHPIVNDIQYGGSRLASISASEERSIGLDEAKRRQQKSQGVVNAGDLSNGFGLHLPSISTDDVKAARQVCRFCTSGPEAAFTPAQLLQGGHEICLHAYRYRVPIHQRSQRCKKPRNQAMEGDASLSGPMWVMDLNVGMPQSWVFAVEQLRDLELPTIKV